MAPGLEFEGKNVEKAVQKACDTLHTTADKLRYDVISFGSTGIFGLVGTKKARIRVLDAESEPDTLSDAQELSSLHDKANNEEAIPEIEAAPIPVPDHEAVAPEGEPTDVTESVILGQQVLQEIIDFITADAQVHMVKNSEGICFNVEGGNAALLIGKRGQTLEAIQYLVDKIINKKSKEKVRIQIDIEGYIENRRASLEKLSSKLAEKAKRTGKPVTIGQMNSHDRRIVHLYLKNDHDVTTQSLGDGFYRKLVIFPKQRKRQQ
jgi:spoIIIJ-associated protein